MSKISVKTIINKRVVQCSNHAHNLLLVYVLQQLFVTPVAQWRQAMSSCHRPGKWCLIYRWVAGCGQDSMIWSTVCSGWPQSHAAVLKSSAFHGGSKTANKFGGGWALSIVCVGGLLPGDRLSCLQICATYEWSAVCHSSDYLLVSHIPPETSASVDRRSWWACSAKGHRDFRLARCGVFVATWWRRWSPLLVALRDSVRTAASRHKVGGAMPARIESWLTGVAPDSRDRTQDIVKRRVQFLGVGAPAPDWGAVLGGGEDQRLGRDA